MWSDDSGRFQKKGHHLDRQTGESEEMGLFCAMVMVQWETALSARSVTVFLFWL
jgi:hypothetical protein